MTNFDIATSFQAAGIPSVQPTLPNALRSAFGSAGAGVAGVLGARLDGERVKREQQQQ